MPRSVPCLVALLVWLLLQWFPILDTLEIQALDFRFAHAHRQLPVDARLVLILVDEASLNAESFAGHPNPLKDEATAYWLPRFGQVIRGVLENGASTVALDWIPWDIPEAVYRLVNKDLRPDQFPWEDMGLAATEYPGRWIQAVGADDPNSAQNGRTFGSHKAADEILALVGRENLGYVNLSVDSDEAVRRQLFSRLPVRPREQKDWGVTSLPAFAALVAERQKFGPPLFLEEGHYLRINYLPSGQSFPHYSFGEVLAWSRYQPQRLRAAFAGKVVLIGASSPIFHDVFNTPIGLLPGVEIHANTLNTLFSDSPLRPLQSWERMALNLLFALTGAFLALKLRALPGTTVAIAIAALYGCVCWEMFARASLWLPWIRPLLTFLVSWLVVILVRIRRDERVQGEVRQLFGRYVSDEVMSQLLRDPRQTIVGAVGKKHVTVLFSDINGFSGQCERRTPEEVLGMLNDYFHEMNEIIFTYGGTIKQFVGDEIMVMYGAPGYHPHPEISAVRSAVDMSKRLRVLRSKDPEGHGFYEIKVGIHTGEVILGNVGSKRRTEYAAIGDDVNLGSRIMGMTRALEAEILISSQTYEKVKDLEGIRFIPKGSHPVKGRREPVEIYQVVPEEDS